LPVFGSRLSEGQNYHHQSDKGHREQYVRGGSFRSAFIRGEGAVERDIHEDEQGGGPRCFLDRD